MVGKEKLEKMEARRSFRNLWHASLMRTPIDDPTYCCFALWCGPCASYLLRKRALRDDMSRYECCGGYMPCSGKCGESKCPELCLCSEVFFCFNNSVSSTRFMLQDEFNIQTTKCDNCIIGTMVCFQSLACIFALLAMITGIDEVEDMAQLLDCIADMIACVVCPCMQTQHKLEMDKRDGKLGDQPVMFAPPIQEMSRTDQCIPPAMGYPPPSVYPPLDPRANAFPPAIYPMQPQPDQGHPPPLYPPYPKDQNDPPATYPPQLQNQQLAAYPPQNQQVYPPQSQNQQLVVYPPQTQNEQLTAYHPQPQNEQPSTYAPQHQNQQLAAYPPQQQNQQLTAYPPQPQTQDGHTSAPPYPPQNSSYTPQHSPPTK